MAIEDSQSANRIEPTLKIADVERIMRIDRRTIFRLCQLGQFPLPIRIGGSRRWRVQDIEQLLNNQPE
jgi:predicted DNA-binding transcriptional regulator AlpA